jgi:hypothetical protein
MSKFLITGTVGFIDFHLVAQAGVRKSNPVTGNQ